MAIKIQFDPIGNPELPVLILAKKNGEKFGKLEAKGVVVSDHMNDASEIQFEVDKYMSDGSITNLWDEITNFRLIWCQNWDTWFEITVELSEDDETTKTIYCTRLGQAELSQINLYDIEINTETDIERPEYEIPTVLYNPDAPEASLLHRIMENAPHYSVIHVDSTIANIQRTFSFDSTSIYDAFQEIADEIGCLFVFNSDSDSDGKPNRTISVYDLESNCKDCGYRGEFTTVCPECGSSNIDEGYGEDTTIFVSADALATQIQFKTDTDSVKNCFKLEGGDDLMTATIMNCNPNGSDRIWRITDESKKDMSDDLVSGLEEYDKQYAYYQNDYVVESIPDDMISSYNNLVTKYKAYDSDLAYLPDSIVGYPAIMEALYETIDFELYLQSELMPSVSLSDTSAEEQAALLTADNISPVAVTSIANLSLATANSVVLTVAKVVVSGNYQVKVNESSLSNYVWKGNFTVTNYSDEDDTAVSATISVEITDDYESYLLQTINKTLKNSTDEDYDITSLFQEDLEDFCGELQKYCLDSLTSFYDACQSCLDILIEQGVGSNETWANSDPNLYDELYVPYYNKLNAIESEMTLRQSEIDIIAGTYDEDGYVDTDGMETYLYDERSNIQAALDFEAYLGEDLWLEFSAFRREDKYSNDNYISDGLTNAELFANALEFIEVANKELYKSSELQHSIASTLQNLLAIDKFEPLLDYFEIGNWLRIMIDDEIYKLRLIGYEIDFDNFNTLSVEFSDVMKTMDGLSDKESIIDQMKSMTTSYDAVKRQSEQGSSSYETISGWTQDGLDVTNTKLLNVADNETQSWDNHGMLFRKYDYITETYDDEQMKIIHSTIAITSDNWKSVRTAIGGFYYTDPVTNELTYAYGINGEVLVGQLILGENLGIYNDSGSLRFDSNGLTITNGTNTFTVNPSDSILLTLSNSERDILWVDKEGTLHIVADGNGLDISANETISGLKVDIDELSETVSTQSIVLQSQIEQMADSVTITLSKSIETISETTEGLQSQLESYATYFSFLEEGLQISQLNSPFAVLLGTTRLSFTENGSEMAYFSNSMLYIHDAEVLSSLKIGNFRWQIGDNGNLNLAKVG